MEIILNSGVLFDGKQVLELNLQLDNMSRNFSPATIYGVYMQTKPEVINYTIEELSVILAVQNVLLESRGSFEKYLMVPQITGLTSYIQKGIYDILNSYQHRVSMPDWTGVTFLYYSYEQLTTIKSYFARFNKALQIIAIETPKLKQSKIGEFQLTLIEICLKGNLDKMAVAMKDTPWSQAIKNLSFETSIQKIPSIPNPITGVKDGQVSLDLCIHNPLLNKIAELVRNIKEKDAQIVCLSDLNHKLKEQNQAQEKKKRDLENENQELKDNNQVLIDLFEKSVVTSSEQENTPKRKLVGQRVGFFPEAQTVASSMFGLIKLAVDPDTLSPKQIEKLFHSQFGVILYKNSLFDVDLNHEKVIFLIEETIENRQYIRLLKNALANMNEGIYMPANKYICRLLTEITDQSFARASSDYSYNN